MLVAIWIIAICEVIRALQNMIQLITMFAEKESRKNVYSEFVKSLKMNDRDYVKKLLEEFERNEGE